MSSAVVMNLSLLTADVYALIVGIFLFGYSFHGLYFVTYISIMVGVAIYVARNPVDRDDSQGVCANLFCKTPKTSDVELQVE